MGDVSWTAEYETCDLSPTTLMGTMFSCDLTQVLNYKGNEKDIWINYATLLLTLLTVVMCTRRAGESASRFSRAAAWFWLPFTIVLFAMQIFADCSTGSVGISAVWSALAGFIFLSWRRVRHISGGSPREAEPATALLTRTGPRDTFWSASIVLASLVVWTGVCMYYAIVEEAMTTVAHLVAFGVGAAGLLLFEALHQISAESAYVTLERSAEGRVASKGLPPWPQTHEHAQR